MEQEKGQRRIASLLSPTIEAEAQSESSPEFIYRYSAWIYNGGVVDWWAHQDLNLEPTDYESAALTVEL